MFGVPNIDGRSELPIDGKASGTEMAKRRGEIDAGIRGQSPCVAMRAG